MSFPAKSSLHQTEGNPVSAPVRNSAIYKRSITGSDKALGAGTLKALESAETWPLDEGVIAVKVTDLKLRDSLQATFGEPMAEYYGKGATRASAWQFRIATHGNPRIYKALRAQLSGA